MNLRIIFILCCFSLAAEASAREELVLARVTGYWRAEGCGQIAGGTGERLHLGHCAVDPRRIPYGSKVVFPDAECVAVDTGPAVVSRASAKSCGRTAAQKNALVIDRFFETRQQAVAWSNAHPQFMTIRIVYPDRAPHQPKQTLLANSAVPPKSVVPGELITPNGEKLPQPRGVQSAPTEQVAGRNSLTPMAP